MRLNGKFFASIALLAAAVAGSFLSQYVGKSQAQLSATQTWIPSANVGGTANAVILTLPNVTATSNLLGVPIRFVPGSPNVAGATTVAIHNGFSTVVTAAVYRNSGGALVPIAGGDFGSGSPIPYAEIVWDGTEFVQTNPATWNAPVGTVGHFSGPTAPAGWLIANGTCILKTTYSALYAYYGGSGDLWATQAGSSCSAGSFTLPFANGRTAVAYDQQGSETAGVLTNSGSGCPATAVAVGCGAQNRTLAQANLGTSWSFPNSGITLTNGSTNVSGCDSFLGLSTPGGCGSSSVTPDEIIIGRLATGSAGNYGSLVTTNVSVNAQGSASSNGSGTPVTTVQPTYTILVAIKY